MRNLVDMRLHHSNYLQRHHVNTNKLNPFQLDANIPLLVPENEEGLADLTRLSQELKLALQNFWNMVSYLDLVSYGGGYKFHHMSIVVMWRWSCL